MLKTGPLKTVCCFEKKMAPIGIIQIQEEDGKSIDECLDHLALNDSEAVARTDAGSGWP